MSGTNDTRPERDQAIRGVLLRRYGPLAKAIGTMFGRHCEVVIHALDDYDHAVIAIVNGEVTGRSEGAPITDLAAQILHDHAWTEDGFLANYSSTTDDGRIIKGTTVVLHGDDGQPIGLLCINLDTSAPVAEFIHGILATTPTSEDGSPGDRAPSTTHSLPLREHFPKTPQGLLELALREARANVAYKSGLSPVERNRAIVEELDRRGVFSIKSAVDTVAEDLGTSRYTVYNYLHEVRGKQDQHKE